MTRRSVISGGGREDVLEKTERRKPAEKILALENLEKTLLKTSTKGCFPER